MTAAETMLRAFRDRTPGFALPRDFYRDEAFHRLDVEHLFHKDWIFVGHDCEVAKAGDFFTVQVGDYPLIVTRDGDGRLHAHHNTCRHRGSRLCDTERGSVKRFVCPYHQWTYDPDGSLVRVRAMEQEGFDRRAFSLKPAHIESVGGYIFVSVAETPPDFAPFREMVAPYFAPFDLAERQGRPRRPHRRGRQLEARAREQPRVLPLRRVASGTLPHLPGGAVLHADDQQPGRRGHRDLLERRRGGRPPLAASASPTAASTGCRASR